jgi:hypothetical protein
MGASGPIGPTGPAGVSKTFGGVATLTAESKGIATVHVYDTNVQLSSVIVVTPAEDPNKRFQNWFVHHVSEGSFQLSATSVSCVSTSLPFFYVGYTA